MPSAHAIRFQISFDPWYRLLSRACFISPAQADMTISKRIVDVRMAWAFHARFSLESVVTARAGEHGVVSRGVHGLGGRWLVNGSGRGLVVLRLAEGTRARVLGVPVALGELTISVEDPAGVLTALGAAIR
ncbi:MAG: hypothetical protein RL385_1354 [Pseudomonadota bacterium]|jgi:hypothetical protein